MIQIFLPMHASQKVCQGWSEKADRSEEIFRGRAPYLTSCTNASTITGDKAAAML